MMDKVWGIPYVKKQLSNQPSKPAGKIFAVNTGDWKISTKIPMEICDADEGLIITVNGTYLKCTNEEDTPKMVAAIEAWLEVE